MRGSRGPSSRAPIVPGVEFRTIVRFPIYTFGDDGSIWGCSRPSTGDVQSNGWGRLRQWKNRFGYLQAHLYVNGETKSFRSHRLILEAFVGPCPEGLAACHNDGDRSNNRLSNLRWDTFANNQSDARRHGTMAIGSRQGLSKINESIATTIRVRIAGGERPTDLAGEYGITYRCLRNVVARNTWKHVS